MAEETQLRAKILTVSDSVSRGDAADRAGDGLAETLTRHGFFVADRTLSPDGVEEVSSALRRLSADFTGLVVTTGGTGFGPRDLTPEGTAAVIEREAPGLAEAMRLVNPLGRLSRATAGVVGTTLVLNTPGSPAGAVECLEAVIDVVPHVISLLRGESPHPHAPHVS